MQRLVHEKDDQDLEFTKTELREIISGPGQLQCWGWKHYQSSIQMFDGDYVGDNPELFSRGDWKTFRRNDNICRENQEMVQGVNECSD